MKNLTRMFRAVSKLEAAIKDQGDGNIKRMLEIELRKSNPSAFVKLAELESYDTDTGEFCFVIDWECREDGKLINIDEETVWVNFKGKKPKIDFLEI
jgi:hypothetical protein